MLPALPLVLAATLFAAPVGQTQDEAVRLSIVVDKSCLIQPESDPLVLDDHIHAFRDEAVCHRESLLSSHHIEEKTRRVSAPASLSVLLAGIRRAKSDKPAIFIVRHIVPQNWTVDSDSQPSSMDGSTAVFLVNAEPGKE